MKGASHEFNLQDYLAGKMTPVYFGSAINNFGIKELLDDYVRYAPSPQPRNAQERVVSPNEEPFSGFVFKIQANMDQSTGIELHFYVYAPELIKRDEIKSLAYW